MTQWLLANSLSPVMWRTVFLLYFGNAMLGIAEGAIIARAFRRRMLVCIPLLIIANYASMGVGLYLFGLGERRSPVPDRLFEIPLHHPNAILWLCLLISFVVSLVVEWPFVLLAFAKAKHALRRSLMAVLLANAISYPLLILLFSDSTNTIGDEVTVTDLSEIVPPSLQATVYFIGDDGAVYTINLDGSYLTLFRHTTATGIHDVLGWVPLDAKDEESWQLVLDRWREKEVLLTNPDGRCEGFLNGLGTITTNGWSLGTWGIADFRTPEDRAWTYTPRVNSGIYLFNEETREEIVLTYDTPFVSWFGRCITVLPGDIAVFELGRQICVLSVPDRKIAFLARGQGPVVLLPESADR